MSQEIREPRPLPHRDEGNDAAIVFLHGFSGHIEGTWGEFPELLKADSRLGGWDIFSITYDTNLRLDIPGIWSASPPLERLAILLTTVADTHFARYKSLAFVTRSMGGLVLQRALVENDTFAQRVGHVALFGTPAKDLQRPPGSSSGSVRFATWRRGARSSRTCAGDGRSASGNSVASSS